MPLESMPLAAGYLKATLDSDPDITSQAHISIHNFRGGAQLPEMAKSLFSDRVPDVLAFSVLGWNYRTFGSLAETYKQLRPDGLVVFGGNHVAYQQDRVFHDFPAVDVVVNGEGEFVLRDIVRATLGCRSKPDFDGIGGLAQRRHDGSVNVTAERDRIADLDLVPSPFLTKSIPMSDGAGRFLYDVSLMETNRGCPYKCAFCYWGGAVGQRVRSFSRARLNAELDFFGFYQVPTIVLCDANFGMLEADEEFVEDLIKVKERYGYPHALETSWAKNKSSRFHRIVRELRRHGLKSSFTLALQTLSDTALSDMNRKNMKVNQWDDLASWLSDEGLDCYAELIWGAPGETPQSFMDGYDTLAEKVPRIAVYPLLLLPNTDYIENRDKHGFVTLRGESDDFEYVLATRSAPLSEHLEMHRFIFFARIFSENQYFRHVWGPARVLAGIRHSEVIRSVMEWFERSTDSAASSFLTLVPTLAESPAVARGVRALYGSAALSDVLTRWWAEEMIPRFPDSWQEFAAELFRYEGWTRPRYTPPAAPPATDWCVDPTDSQHYYLSRPVTFGFIMPDILATIGTSSPTEPALRSRPPTSTEWQVRFRALKGFYDHCDNHETAVHYSANPVPSESSPSIPDGSDKMS